MISISSLSFSLSLPPPSFPHVTYGYSDITRGLQFAAILFARETCACDLARWRCVRGVPKRVVRRGSAGASRLVRGGACNAVLLCTGEIGCSAGVTGFGLAPGVSGGPDARVDLELKTPVDRAEMDFWVCGVRGRTTRRRRRQRPLPAGVAIFGGF